MAQFIKIKNERINPDKITHYLPSEKQNEYSLTIFFENSSLGFDTSNKAELESWLKALGEE